MSSLILRLVLMGCGCAAAGCTVGSPSVPFPAGDRPIDVAPPVSAGGRELMAWRALSEGATDVAEGRPEQALLVFERVTEFGLDDPMLYFLRGVAHLDAGHGEEAVIDLSQSVAMTPTDTASYSALARAWRLLGDPLSALSVLADGIEATEGDLRLMVLQGYVQLEVGHWQDAFDTLRTVAEQDPESVEAHRALGVLFCEIGDAESAELSWRSALRLDPDDPLLLAGLGNALRDLGQDEDSLECYRAASEAEPESAVHLANIASALVRLDRLPEARNAYEDSLRAKALPPEPRSFIEMNLAHVLERIGEEEGAMVAYESAVSGDPTLGAAHEALGLLLLDRADEVHALEHLRAAMGTGRLSTEAMLHLGLLAERLGEPELTRQCALLLEVVDDPVAAFRLAQLLVRSTDPEVHDPDAAIPILRGLLDGVFASKGAVWNVLGEALASQGSYEEAAWAAEHALGHVDPDDPVAGYYQRQRMTWLASLQDG
jgi:tetratricopeptide (TPR) repeat protein